MISAPSIPQRRQAPLSAPRISERPHSQVDANSQPPLPFELVTDRQASGAGDRLRFWSLYRRSCRRTRSFPSERENSSISMSSSPVAIGQKFVCKQKGFYTTCTACAYIPWRRNDRICRLQFRSELSFILCFPAGGKTREGKPKTSHSFRV